MGIAFSIIGGGMITLLVAHFYFKRTSEDLEELRDEIRDDVRENLDALVTVARGLEEAFQSGRLEFNYDDKDKPEGIVIHLGASGTGESTGNADPSVTEGEDDELTETARAQDVIEEEVIPAGEEPEDEEAGLGDDLPLDDELEIKRDRPEG